jgi:hypothetical protein
MASVYSLNFRTACINARELVAFERKNKLPITGDIHRLNLKLRHIEDRVLPMAKKKSQVQSWSTKFVPLKLTKADKKAFDAWAKEQTAQHVDALLEMVTDGWKVGFSFDGEHDTFICSATCKDEDSVNHDYCIVSRSNDAYEALFMNYYKLSVMADGNVSKIEDEGDWG